MSRRARWTRQPLGLAIFVAPVAPNETGRDNGAVIPRLSRRPLQVADPAFAGSGTGRKRVPSLRSGVRNCVRVGSVPGPFGQVHHPRPTRWARLHTSPVRPGPKPVAIRTSVDRDDRRTRFRLDFRDCSEPHPTKPSRFPKAPLRHVPEPRQSPASLGPAGVASAYRKISARGIL